MLKHLLQIEYNNFLLLSLLEIVICKYLKIRMISLNQNLEFHRSGGAGFQCNFLVSVTREKNSIINVEVLIEWKLDERKSTDHSATPIVLYTTSLYFFYRPQCMSCILQFYYYEKMPLSRAKPTHNTNDNIL